MEERTKMFPGFNPNPKPFPVKAVETVDDITEQKIYWVDELNGFVTVLDVTPYGYECLSENHTLYECINCKPVSHEAKTYCYVFRRNND